MTEKPVKSFRLQFTDVPKPTKKLGVKDEKHLFKVSCGVSEYFVCKDENEALEKLWKMLENFKSLKEFFDENAGAMEIEEAEDLKNDK